MSTRSREIIGKAPALQQMLSLIRRVAPTKTNLLVIGESGTGKELVARMIHDSGPLKDKPFVPVNCGAIPENLIESELFGHKRGSFTGAVADKPGLFEVASGGTLFLDEVGELPLAMQVKLLRALQERMIRKVGGTDDIRVDARIIAATNRDLEEAVKKGTFREDLYYRLNVIQIKTPPLRERREDIRLLAETFLERNNKKYSRKLEGFDELALKALESYSWPGNVRELENVIERAVTLESHPKIGIGSLTAHVQSAVMSQPRGPEQPKTEGAGSTSSPTHGNEIRLPAPDFDHGPIDLDKVLMEVERTYLTAALNHAGGVKKKAAEALGITFRSIRYRLQKIGLEAGNSDESDESE